MPTKIPKPELELQFRHYIGPRLKEHVMFTWHEDRTVSPGVPDMHYCFRPETAVHPFVYYQVGWLELKAIETSFKSGDRIGVEPSQRQYFRQWEGVMPIHFLIRVRENIYLVPGHYHSGLGAIASEDELDSISIVGFQQKQLAETLIPVLKSITRI